MKIHCRYDFIVSPDDLKPYEKNRNKHSEEQIERLAKLLAYQGMRAPVIVDADDKCTIVKGHGTVMAIKKLGVSSVPVVCQAFENEEQRYAFVQSDNAIASWSELDFAGINLDLPELGPDFDIDLLGLKGFTIDPSELPETEPKQDPKDKDANMMTCPNCQALIEKS